VTMHYKGYICLFTKLKPCINSSSNLTEYGKNAHKLPGMLAVLILLPYLYYGYFLLSWQDMLTFSFKVYEPSGPSCGHLSLASVAMKQFGVCLLLSV